MGLTQEQLKILENNKKNLIVSASAGSGKTFVVIEYLINLITLKHIPLNKILVLTFTKAAANEMKTRLQKALLKQKPDSFITSQLDEIFISDISTIDSFCEKLIKRNIDKLKIDESFNILDSDGSENLKRKAFNETIAKLCSMEDFEKVYFTFKKNKEEIYKCFSLIQNFLDSRSQNDNFLSTSKDFISYTHRAEKYLTKYLKNIFNKANKFLMQIENIEEKFLDYFNILKNITQFEFYDDFFDNLKYLNEIYIPPFPRYKANDLVCKKNMQSAQKLILKAKALSENFASLTREDYQNLITQQIAPRLFEGFQEYYKAYNSLKVQSDVLDFSDIEKYVSLLLQDEDILKDLQEKYDYIFIDEYQDTNPLQEAIIKPIAKHGNFIAVGDQKQGIYGFRNASMEIMQKDIDDFSKDENSESLTLTGNFRSDGRCLDFINKIFEKVMTKESVGIDYKNTSMLKGMTNFEKMELPSVSTIIVQNDKIEKEDLRQIYSVKEDTLKIQSKNQREVQTIITCVDKVLNSDIYDGKLQRKRKVNVNDIAIIFRSRSALMNECYSALCENGYKVVANLNNSLIDDGQIKILICILNLTLTFKDDISLASVLNSYIGGFSLDEIVKLKGEGLLWQKVIESEDDKVKSFKQLIDDFKFDCQVFGINKAFRKLFNKTLYFSYLSNIDASGVKRGNIEKFLSISLSSGFDFNIPSFLSYLNNSDVKSVQTQNNQDCITMTTIHATKGLEYPIVIIAGAGEKLSKPNMRSYNIEDEFGVGTMMIDFENNIKYPSPSFLANNLYKKRKEFIDELMIFYVAMTRVQNHLFIIGQKQEKDITFSDDVFDLSDYLEIIFNSFGQSFTSQLFNQEKILTENFEFLVVSQDNELDKKSTIKQQNFIKNIKNLKNYIYFNYPYKDVCKLSFKNSVTGILNLENEEKLALLSTSTQMSNNENSITQGLAYHEALKLIDFNKISNYEDLVKELKIIEPLMTENYIEFIDKQILYNNILIIKKVVKSQKVFKEKEFVMSCSLEEIGVKNSKENVLVQGICDLYSLGEENILIDYKFTSIENESKLKEKYLKQINLYSLALEKAYNIKLNKIYLLSLKNCKLVEII